MITRDYIRDEVTGWWTATYIDTRLPALTKTESGQLDLTPIVSQGETFAEAHKNLREAVKAWEKIERKLK